jgi:acetoin utilization deacetylase AcuC-like enzyme
MGFCYLSNAAIAAKYAREHRIRARRGEPNRVAVIDIDHHRGNGTGAGAAGESDILFVDVVYKSSYDEVRRCYTDGDGVDPVSGRYINSGKEYPYTRDDASIGARAHRVVTAPNILSLEMGQSTAEQIMERFVTEALPRIRAFKPDVILWSLGVDSALGDPLGGLGNLPSSFYTFTRGMRLAFPNARHGGVLEGGYQPENWARCLKPALLGLHLPANNPPDRSKFFARFRDRFTA